MPRWRQQRAFGGGSQSWSDFTLHVCSKGARSLEHTLCWLHGGHTKAVCKLHYLYLLSREQLLAMDLLVDAVLGQCSWQKLCSSAAATPVPTS